MTRGAARGDGMDLWGGGRNKRWRSPGQIIKKNSNKREEVGPLLMAMDDADNDADNDVDDDNDDTWKKKKKRSEP